MSKMLSVVLASFNGEDFIRDQIESILPELGALDELVVVDDCSTDTTAEIVAGFASAEPRVRLVRKVVNEGHVKAFEVGIRRARGSFVFLSDQDDIWPEGRVLAMSTALHSAPVVVGSVRVFSNDANRNGTLMGFHSGLRSTFREHFTDVLLLHLGKLPYYGSAMGFQAGFLKECLPFPKSTVAHDHWFALRAHARGRQVQHLSDVVVLRREAGQNLSSLKRPLLVRLRYRVTLAGLTLRALQRGRS